MRYAWRGCARAVLVATTVLTLAVGLGLVTVARHLQRLRAPPVRRTIRTVI
jgi:hypothetical protein